MSSATPSPLPERDHALYVRDMLAFCDAVLSYTAGHDLASLLADRLRYDATQRNLRLIGEAATHVPTRFGHWRPACRDARWSAPATAWRMPTSVLSRIRCG